MKVTIELCGICKTEITKDNRFGLVIEVGHSSGGWGHREDDLKFSDEVCRQCGEHAVSKIRAAWHAAQRERQAGAREGGH